MNYKEVGNDFFRKSQWSKAKDMYTKALESDPQMFTALANRAACSIQLKEYSAALRDCEEAIIHAEGTLKMKVLWRMAVCLRQLGLDELRWREIVHEGLKCDPKNPKLQEEQTYLFVRRLPTMPDEYLHVTPQQHFQSEPPKSQAQSKQRHLLPTMPLTYQKLLQLTRMNTSDIAEFWYANISGSDLQLALKTAGVEPDTLDYICKLVADNKNYTEKNTEYIKALQNSPRFDTALFMADEAMYCKALAATNLN